MTAHPSKRLTWAWAALALTLTNPALAQTSSIVQDPDRITVLARVLFGPDGTPTEAALVGAEDFPRPFADAVLSRIQRTRIPPPRDGDQPATLRSGVEVTVQTRRSPEGTRAAITAVELVPLPLERVLAAYPKDIAGTGDWRGEATGLCVVGIDGRCSRIEVRALPGMPESVRRHLRASLERWVFEPQQLAGRAIEGEYRLTVRYHTIDSKPEDFREDKFDRIQKSR